MDKPHGLREAYLVDVDGYVWVPDVPNVAQAHFLANDKTSP